MLLIATGATAGAFLSYALAARGSRHSTTMAVAAGILAGALVSSSLAFWIIALSPRPDPFVAQLDSVLRVIPLLLVLSPLAAIAGARAARRGQAAGYAGSPIMVARRRPPAAG